MSKLIVCVAAVLIATVANARDIPDYIHICRRSDPQVAKCIRESVEVLRPRLKVGIPELDVPSLEPLHINEIEIFRGDGPGRFKAVLKNLEARGVGDFKITKLKLNIDKNTYRVGVQFPAIRVVGDYDIDIRLLSIPLKGNGKFTANITNPEGQGVIKAELIEKNGHREMVFKSFDFAIKIDDYDIHLDNLFEGDPTLSKAANEVLHSNKAEFIQAALPFIQSKAAEIILRAANKVTQDLDYDKVFPV